MFRNRVSILVLMDTLLQHIVKSFGIQNAEDGFNPCFNGYTTSTDRWEKENKEPLKNVSILVLMDTLLQPQRVAELALDIERRFQSLF